MFLNTVYILALNASVNYTGEPGRKLVKGKNGSMMGMKDILMGRNQTTSISIASFIISLGKSLVDSMLS